MMHRMTLSIVALAGFVASGTASAHAGIDAGGFSAGLLHPFLGLDHLLAMVAVGIWAVQLGGRHLIFIPMLFVLFMAAGAAGAVAGANVPYVESGDALSVLGLGLLVALSLRASWFWAIPLIAVFALYHGHAHGAEMPAFAVQWQYFAGFLIATALLHAAGVTGGVALRNHSYILRIGGAAIGLLGTWLVLT